MKLLIMFFLLTSVSFSDRIRVTPKELSDIIKFMMENCGQPANSYVTVGIYGANKTRGQLISNLQEKTSNFQYLPEVKEDFRSVDTVKFIYSKKIGKEVHPFSIVFSDNISNIRHVAVLIYIKDDKIIIMINVEESERLKLKFSNGIIGSVGFYSPDTFKR